LSSALLVLLLEVVIVAVTTTMIVSVVMAVAAVLLANWFLVQPHHTFLISNPEDVVVLTVFVLSAVTASIVVTQVQRSQQEAAKREFEAQAMRASMDLPAAESDPGAVLAQLRTRFELEWLEVRSPVGRVVASSGTPSGSSFDQTLVDEELPDGYRLIGEGPARIGLDRRLLVSLGTVALRSEQTRQLASEAARAEELAAVDQARSALLAAVGHDLRTPIATIAVSAQALTHHELSEADRDSLVATVHDSTQRLDSLVTNLLDMSRLEAGALIADLHPTAVEEVTAQVAMHVGPELILTIPDACPDVLCDEGLLERVLANLVSNAQRYGAGSPVELAVHDHGDRVEFAIVDHGPGLRGAGEDQVFEPFSTAGDRTPGGVGLGLAIARGFTEAMHGTLEPSTTPGGGLTMSVFLPVAP
jgi:K+-sensing histidine kinase KdpD